MVSENYEPSHLSKKKKSLTMETRIQIPPETENKLISSHLMNL